MPNNANDADGTDSAFILQINNAMTGLTTTDFKNEYITAPGRLEDEWVYRRFPEDWQNFHTRYVTPDVFQNAMRSKQRK